MPHSTLLADLPNTVRIVEVGPRDGLQNETAIVSTAEKVRYVELLANAGFGDVEVSSFVSPKRVPQLADAAEVFGLLTRRAGTRYSALVPNLRGLERAIAAGVKAIALFTAASESFTQRNIGKTIEQSLAEFRDIVPEARAAGMSVRAYVSTAFYCPYEGAVPTNQVVGVVGTLVNLGVDEVSIGDTIGHAVPSDVARLSDAVAVVLPRSRTAYHFHDTRGTALANILTALSYGITVFDSASGGIGGCPFAPGAAGNLATEDLVYMLHGMGVETGVDLGRVVEASRFIEQKLGRPLPGKYLRSCPASGAGNPAGAAACPVV